MAISGPAASFLQVAGPLLQWRVAGVALGRFALSDGRPADRPSDAAEMVENFRPATCPILSRHGGLLLGYLATLRAEGPDLHMTGEVGGWSGLPDLLRGGVPISIETAYGAVPLPDGQRYLLQPAVPLAVRYPYFRGELQLGLNLIGAALTDRPAARGSVLWIVE